MVGNLGNFVLCDPSWNRNHSVSTLAVSCQSTATTNLFVCSRLFVDVTPTCAATLPDDLHNEVFLVKEEEETFWWPSKEQIISNDNVLLVLRLDKQKKLDTLITASVNYAH